MFTSIFLKHLQEYYLNKKIKYMNFKTIILIFLLISTIFVLALSYDRNTKEVYVEKIESFKEIENIFNKDNDTTYIINFWATTCPPCLKELPLFEELRTNFSDKELKIFLINIDDENRYEKSVKPYVQKLKLENKVYALVDNDYTDWTGKVNQNWYGSLPYTVIYKGSKRKFFFGAFENEQQLEKEIIKMLK